MRFVSESQNKNVEIHFLINEPLFSSWNDRLALSCAAAPSYQARLGDFSTFSSVFSVQISSVNCFIISTPIKPRMNQKAARMSR
jgi:hypothetical protein